MPSASEGGGPVFLQGRRRHTVRNHRVGGRIILGMPSKLNFRSTPQPPHPEPCTGACTRPGRLPWQPAATPHPGVRGGHHQGEDRASDSQAAGTEGTLAAVGPPWTSDILWEASTWLVRNTNASCNSAAGCWSGWATDVGSVSEAETSTGVLFHIGFPSDVFGSSRIIHSQDASRVNACRDWRRGPHW